jgi:tetratricopeptide (TPR) repeat protein
MRTPAGAVEAVRALSAAVGRDSTYTEAWAALARTYVRVYGRGFGLPGVPDDSVVRLAVAASDRALAGDRRSADAWKTQGIVSRVVDPTDNTPALRALRQAVALDSTDAESWMLLGTSTAETGDMTGAIAAWHRGVTAGPSNAEALAFVALGYYWRRQYDSAARWADSSMAVDPNFVLARTTVGTIAVERREVARARAAFDAAARLTTGVEEINALAGAALVEARAGAPAKARGLLARAESLFTGRPRPSSHTAVFMAEAYAGLGDADHAVGWLERYEPVNDLHFQLHLRCDPSLDPIGDDRRFRAMLLKSRPIPPGGC